MKRKVIIFPLPRLITADRRLMESGVKIYIDDIFFPELSAFLPPKMSQMLVKLNWILRGVNSYNDGMYSKYGLSLNKKYKDVTAIKFKSGSNTRILCREFISTNKKSKRIVMVEIIEKKTYKKDKALIARMEAIGRYTYEF